MQSHQSPEWRGESKARQMVRCSWRVKCNGVRMGAWGAAADEAGGLAGQEQRAFGAMLKSLDSRRQPGA